MCGRMLFLILMSHKDLDMGLLDVKGESTPEPYLAPVS